jgi:hypothetical protein
MKYVATSWLYILMFNIFPRVWLPLLLEREDMYKTLHPSNFQQSCEIFKKKELKIIVCAIA